MLRSVPQGFTAIDIGSGEGQYVIPYCKSFPSSRFIALDLRRSNQVFCDSFGITNLESICMDIEKDSPRVQADLALCVGVLQYVPDDKTALAHIYQCLRPGGQFLLYVPINGRFLTRLYSYIFERYEHAETVNDRVRVYHEADITQKLRDAGFEITHKTYTYGNAGKLSHELLNICITLILSASMLLKLIAFLMLVLLFPFILVLMIADYMSDKSSGNGVLFRMVRK